MARPFDPSRLAERAALKRRELLTEITPLVAVAIAGIGLVSPSCLPGVALYAGVLLGGLYTMLAAVGAGAARMVPVPQPAH